MTSVTAETCVPLSDLKVATDFPDSETSRFSAVDGPVTDSETKVRGMVIRRLHITRYLRAPRVSACPLQGRVCSS